MPGRILVLDPIATNRIMLKAQLSIDFFDVTLASDFSEMKLQTRKKAPDLILVSYQADAAQDFCAVHWLKSNPATAPIPTAFLLTSDNPSVWDECHDLLVDDVLLYRSNKWLMAARLNILIRGKEQLGAAITRHQALSDMGFAESKNIFPPQSLKQVQVAIADPSGFFSPHFLNRITTQLRKEIPHISVSLETAPQDADVIIVAPSSSNTDTCFSHLLTLRHTTSDHIQNILAVCPTASNKAAKHALELGAKDFTFARPSVAELACRVRRLLWLSHMETQVENSIADTLKLALIDPLTGLYNRRYANQYLTQLLSKDHQTPHTITAMILDLDHFKSINDTYGHVAGDAVISQTASRLKQSLRPADLLARIGGEEFLVVLKDTDETRIRTIAERLRTEISSKSYLMDDGTAISVSASIGVSLSLPNWLSAKALIDCADRALYTSKDHGRDRVTFSKLAA